MQKQVIKKKKTSNILDSSQVGLWKKKIKQDNSVLSIYFQQY